MARLTIDTDASTIRFLMHLVRRRWNRQRQRLSFRGRARGLAEKPAKASSEATTIREQDGRSVLFITLDSCRFDTFMSADVPHLKSVGPLYQAMAPGTFTYASHAAMFVGVTPGVSNRCDPFVNPKAGKFFRIVNGVALRKGTEYFTLAGRNIIDGFNRKGYVSIGSGAVGWFNPDTSTGRTLTQDFRHYFYAGNPYSLARQLSWLESQLSVVQGPVFAFLNVGETHVPYYHAGAEWQVTDNPCKPFNSENRNDADTCRYRQRMCLEFVDQRLAPLLAAFSNATILVCGDHGDAWGEDGLWEHGIYHPKVLEVPLLFRLGCAS